LAGRRSLSISENDYDWLGHGIYFWEYNAQRAFEFACEVRNRPHHLGQRVKRPAVLGAVIDLGLCLNLLDSRFIEEMRQAYEALERSYKEAGEPMPGNVGGIDRRMRRLDCAVIEYVHAARKEQNKPSFDSARAAFVEGNPAYPAAGFYEKTHIQLCVRNPACIKGYFRPLDEEGRPAAFSLQEFMSNRGVLASAIAYDPKEKRKARKMIGRRASRNR